MLSEKARLEYPVIETRHIPSFINTRGGCLQNKLRGLGLPNRIVDDSDSKAPNLNVNFGPIRNRMMKLYRIESYLSLYNRN